MTKQVGMSRNISLEYLDKTVELMNTEDDIKAVKNELKKYISLYINDKTNILKTVSILNNIWLVNGKEEKKIKDYAKQIIKTNNNETLRLAAHWCMMLITYSVFKDIAYIVGKLEYMQIELTSKIIREKMIDLWGERSTLIHAIPKNIKTMRDIKVLEDIKIGTYKIKKHIIKEPKTIVLIASTLIYLKDKLYLSFEELVNDELMFPFDYDLDLKELEDSEMFSFDRFGGQLAISLKEN